MFLHITIKICDVGRIIISSIVNSFLLSSIFLFLTEARALVVDCGHYLYGKDLRTLRSWLRIYVLCLQYYLSCRICDIATRVTDDIIRRYFEVILIIGYVEYFKGLINYQQFL